MLLAAVILSGCGEQTPRVAQAATRFALLGMLHKGANQIKTLTNIPGPAVWAGKCASASHRNTLWGAALVLENQKDSTTVRLLGGSNTEAKRFYASKKEDILSASDSRLTADLKYEDDKHALIGKSRDGAFLVYARMGTSVGKVPIIYLGAISATQKDEHFRCYFSQNKTGRSAEQNDEAENTMVSILH